MDKVIKISLVFLIVLMAIAVSAMVFSALAQGQGTPTTTQQVAEVKEQVQSNDQQIDATTLGTAGAIGVGGLALAREFINSKKLKESDKRTDRDTGRSLLYIYRLIQTMDAKIPAVSECLDQPFNVDPMQKHFTIRMKLAEDAQSTAEYLMTQLNTTVPSMTPSAAVIVADAANTNTASNQTTKTQGTTTTTTTASNTNTQV